MSDYAALIRPADFGPVKHRNHPRSGAPAGGRDAAGAMPYFDTPQKCGQISVVASMPESFGEAMLYV